MYLTPVITSYSFILNYDQCSFGIGRLCSVIDARGQTTFDYDAYGNTIQISEIREGISYVQQYQYDGGHRQISMILPTGRVVNYKRDSLQRIQSITTDVNDVRQSIIENINYNAANRIIQQQYGNGLIENRSYDLQGRLLQQTLNSVEQTGLSYDANSNVLTRNTASESHRYAYDQLDRLVEEINNGTATGYQYDANGNRTQQTQNTQSIFYDYSPDSNQLELITTDSTSQSILYDAAGHLTQDAQGREYRYNNAGRLKEVFNNGQRLASYHYNANGQRSHKITATQTILYHYDLTGQLSSETLGDSTPIRDYIWQDNTPIAQIDYQGGTPSLSYLHADHLNTPRLATDTNQSIVWRWESDAFGKEQPQSLGTTINFRFPGQYFDLETGLYYNYFRYYDPQTGRYITSDPIGLAGGLNTYAYVAGNPLKFVDYLGLAIGDFPPPPPGYNRSTWSHGTFDNGRHYLTEPNKGRTYIIHPEDKGHWRHWDVYPPDDNDGNSSGGKKRLPENSKKGWPNQKKFKPDQCPVDPNGDAEPWEPTDEQRAWEDFYNAGPFPYFTPYPRFLLLGFKCLSLECHYLFRRSFVYAIK